MTFNELIKQIPEGMRDSIVMIDCPQLRPGDEGDYPLAEVEISQSPHNINEYRITLIPDIY